MALVTAELVPPETRVMDILEPVTLLGMATTMLALYAADADATECETSTPKLTDSPSEYAGKVGLISLTFKVGSTAFNDSTDVEFAMFDTCPELALEIEDAAMTTPCATDESVVTSNE